jgi:hypothetical protein
VVAISPFRGRRGEFVRDGSRAFVALEPEPGRTLVQTDTGSSGLITTFTVTPQDERALVNITSSFDGESGVAGFVERIIAPRRLHRVYVKELARIDAYAREQRVGYTD